MFLYIFLYVLALFAIFAIAFCFLLCARRSTINPRPGAQQTEVKFVYKVKDDNPDVNYSIEVGETKDAEGNVIPDAQVSVEVASDNADSVSVIPGDNPKAGAVHFGNPGQATVTATVKDGSGNLLGAGTASFLVTTGDPASIAGVSLA